MVVVCAISGFPPEEPVVSKDGYIFEKRLIERVIADTGKCPITGCDLSLGDLRPVLASGGSKAVTIDSASLPDMISSFEKQWEQVLIDQFNLRAELHAAKEELAKALYEQEASVRVIARLTRERDQALGEVTKLQEDVAQIQYSRED